MHPRDLPEIVPELITEMHEACSEVKGLNGRAGRLERRMEGAETEVRLMPEENRRNTGRLIEAFGKSIAPRTDRVLTHESRLNCLENSQY